MTTKPSRPPPAWPALTRALPEAATLPFVVDGRPLHLQTDLDALVEHFSRRPPDAYLQAGLVSQLSPARAARGLALRQSQWVFDKFAVATLPERLTWAENPFGDRNWQWQLHSFVMLPALLSAHQQTGDPWYLERSATLIQDWVAANLGETWPCELSWHDHATALRLKNWLYWFEYARARGLDRSVLAVFLPAVAVHAQVLSEPSFYSAHTNHGQSQALTLFLAGAALPEFAAASQWQALGLERLRAEVRFAFAADGVHVENSPSYHVQMLQNTLVADEACRAYTGRALSDEWTALTAAAVDFAAYITRPDGSLPPLGDSGVEAGLPNLSKNLAKAGVTPPEVLRYAASQGRDGVRPAQTDRVFPVSGYAIFRDAWHAAEDFDQGVYLLFKAGFLSTYHRHDDDLSCQLYAYGEDWLIDAGLYRYAEQDPLRQYVRSAQAHNVVTIEGVTAVRTAAGLHQSCLEAHTLGAEAATVTGAHTLYPGFRTERRVEYFKPGRIVLHDTVTAPDDQPRWYQVRFHVPADKAIVLAGGALEIRSQASGRCLRLTFPAARFEAQFVAGRTEPSHLGWWSRQYGQIEPAQCLVLATRAVHLASTVELAFA